MNPRSKLMDDELRRACIAYNSVLLHQPEDCRDQTAAMHAAISPILSRLSAAEARVGVLEEAGTELLSGHDNLYVALFGPAADPRNDIAAKAMRAALTQEPTS